MENEIRLIWPGKKTKALVKKVKLIRKKTFGENKKEKVSLLKNNNLIHGDNLQVLTKIQKKLREKVKCIFIDPPYNTGLNFSHYKDKIDSSVWLSEMRDRLVIMKDLLLETGSIWITVDDSESHYLKVIMDEIFGRVNFIANIVWQRRFGLANDAKFISKTHDHILVYAKDKTKCKFNRLPRPERLNKSYKNPDNHPKGPWRTTNLHRLQKNNRKKSNFRFKFKNGLLWTPPVNSATKFSKESLTKFDKNDEIWFGKNGKSKNPMRKFFLSGLKTNTVVCGSIWQYEDVGYNAEATKEIKEISNFPGPKPERLLYRILTMATNPDDLVLDAFAGSGTTGAVAHKMGRKWLMIEIGDHCLTHIIPRMKQIISGKSKTKVTDLTSWKGGSGLNYLKAI